MLHELLIQVASLPLADALDPIPEAADVKAGWTAFAIFLLLFGAVVVIGFSMSKQFKRANQSREAGLLPSTKDEAAAKTEAEQRNPENL